VSHALASRANPPDGLKGIEPMTYCPPALATGLTGYDAPQCSASVARARIAFRFWTGSNQPVRVHRDDAALIDALQVTSDRHSAIWC
jgi:hypothetical protein